MVKAVFSFFDGQSIVVDVMPVLNNVGKAPADTSPRDDAFRRDLTINALLMEVSSAQQPPSPLLAELIDHYDASHALTATHEVTEPIAGSTPFAAFPFMRDACVLCHGLRWTLLDYVGGVEDLLHAHSLQPPAVAAQSEPGERLTEALNRHWRCTSVAAADRVHFERQLVGYLRRRFPTCEPVDRHSIVLVNAEMSRCVQ